MQSISLRIENEANNVIINGDIQKIIDELMLAENSEILKANN